ncbi:hypothetical protein N5P32_13250, partial [Marinomonas pontica]|uniref:hypothetical protein n=1 Tax=Marinomonas pontica TaxID=264739 RepID=UPI0022439B62
TDMKSKEEKVFDLRLVDTMLCLIRYIVHEKSIFLFFDVLVECFSLKKGGKMKKKRKKVQGVLDQ